MVSGLITLRKLRRSETVCYSILDGPSGCIVYHPRCPCQAKRKAGELPPWSIDKGSIGQATHIIFCAAPAYSIVLSRLCKSCFLYIKVESCNHLKKGMHSVFLALPFPPPPSIGVYEHMPSHVAPGSSM